MRLEQHVESNSTYNYSLHLNAEEVVMLRGILEQSGSLFNHLSDEEKDFVIEYSNQVRELLFV